MKNQEQANNSNNLNDPTVANDPQTLVEDLTISGELEERVKGGGDVRVISGADGSQKDVFKTVKLTDVLVTGYQHSD